MLFSVTNILKYSSLLVLSIIYADNYEKVSYFVPERATLMYYDRVYLNYVNMSTRRYSRKDPLYYFNFYASSNCVCGNNFTAHFYFYEFFTSTYKRSFVEVHSKFCHLLKKDLMFGTIVQSILANYPDLLCPIPIGTYTAENLTMLAVPHFPFNKGRLYINVTFNTLNLTVFSVMLDFEIRVMKIRKTL